MALELKPADKADAYPKVAYHTDGAHALVNNADEMKALGDGYSDKINDKAIRAIRKASGAAKTDPQPGVMYAPVEAY